MGEKVQMDNHAWVDRLLPWFVNNTLDDAERDRVRCHLDSCDACLGSVSLLSTVQDGVRHATATPMVPPPRTGRLLETIDSLDRKRGRLRTMAVTAFAASLAAALAVVTLLLPHREQAVTNPARYETTTTPGPIGSMDYVLDVQFEQGISLAAQQRVLRDAEAKELHQSGTRGMYRVTVNLPASSLEELERYTLELESLGEIKSARVVAVQLPMKPKQ